MLSIVPAQHMMGYIFHGVLCAPKLILNFARLAGYFLMDPIRNVNLTFSVGQHLFTLFYTIWRWRERSANGMLVGYCLIFAQRFVDFSVAKVI